MSADTSAKRKRTQIALAGWSVYNWTDDIAPSQAMARSLAERAAEMSGDDPVIPAVFGAVHTFVRNHGTARVILERAVTLLTQRRVGLEQVGMARELC
jgi:adenylate cyclase